MLVFFNGESISTENLGFDELQRGFDYGDGFFETIFFKNGVPILLDYHLNRLKNAAEQSSLKFEIKNSTEIGEHFKTLWTQGNQPTNAIGKIRIWRKGSNGYDPEGNEIHILISLKESAEYQFQRIENFGIIRSITNRQTILSRFKTMSALEYVLAGKEKLNQGWNEAIILDEKGNYSEGINSNLFMLIDGQWITPKLDSGCIEGIMRRYILDDLRNSNFKLSEEDIDPRKFDLYKFPWFTINSLNFRYFHPKEMESPKLFSEMEKQLKQFVS